MKKQLYPLFRSTSRWLKGSAGTASACTRQRTLRGDKKQSDIFELISDLLSSADLFRDDFLTREDHHQRNGFTPSRWNQSEQSVQQNAVAHFRRGEPSNFEPCADRIVIARVAGVPKRVDGRYCSAGCK